MSLRTLVKTFVPRSLRRRLDRVLQPVVGLFRGRRILLMRPLTDRTPHVFYGYSHIPDSSQHAHGGIIKAQYLQDWFPNSSGRFNILYLISSRIPYGALQITDLAQRKGAKLVWNQNGVAYPAWHGAGWEDVNAPLAKLLHTAQYVFYQSEFCRLSADRYLGVRKGPWEILYNPVDIERFSPLTGDPAPGELVLLLAGNQDQSYRVLSALAVLQELVGRGINAKLLITGRFGWNHAGSQAETTVREWARERGVFDRVSFLGSYSQREAPSIFRRAHILVHTKFNDPCPGVVIEAMACGLPVVYSHSGGVPELVGKDAGIGIPVESTWERDIPPDPKAMAQAVVSVAERRSEFSAAARQRAVENFELRLWLQRHQQVFDGLVR